MSRVFVVLSVFLAGFAPLAGCTGVVTDTELEADSPIRVEEIYLNNEDSADHAVHVVIQRNETVAYWDTIELNGTDGTENGTRISYGETIESETFGASPGRYAVLVRLDGQTSGKRFDVNELAEGCSTVSLQIEIRDDGELLLFRAGSCS